MEIKNAIIIVNYNKKELLEKCLASLALQEGTQHTVFVVDNGSEDGSAHMVREKFPAAVVIDMGYNAGFCRGNNAGIEKAISTGYENIILLNNDTEVDRSFVRELVVQVNREKKIDMVAPLILMHSDRNRIDSAGLVITPDGMALNRLLDKDRTDAGDMREVFCPTGAAALFTARVLEDIKQDGMYFDEDYEYYLEDLDMGWRARLRGFHCTYTPRSIVYHHKNATSGGYSKFIAFYTNRNLYYNIIKNYPFPYCAKALLLSAFRYPYLLWLALDKKGVVSKFNQNVPFAELLIVTMKGMKDVVMHLPKFIKKRRFIQKRKVQNGVAQWFEDYGVGFFVSKK